jgi:hypothetical protein
MSYKRNQIEEAIARIFAPKCEEPPSDLRTRIKQLLDLDRFMGRKPHSKDPEEANLGFFSQEAPGTGSDISFSEYEAFALLNGLKGHGSRLATGLRRFNHAPRPSRSQKGTRADPQATPGEAIRLGSDTQKSPARRYCSRQYGSGVSYPSFEGGARRLTQDGHLRFPPLCAEDWRRSANLVAMWAPRS